MLKSGNVLTIKVLLMDNCYVKLDFQVVFPRKMNGNINCFSDLIVAASKGGFTQILNYKRKHVTQ